jgi:hypothetical protein
MSLFARLRRYLQALKDLQAIDRYVRRENEAWRLL